MLKYHSLRSHLPSLPGNPVSTISQLPPDSQSLPWLRKPSGKPTVEVLDVHQDQGGIFPGMPDLGIHIRPPSLSPSQVPGSSPPFQPVGAGPILGAGAEECHGAMDEHLMMGGGRGEAGEGCCSHNCCQFRVVFIKAGAVLGPVELQGQF